MLVSCIRVGLLPRFAAWSMALDKGARSQIPIPVLSLLHLGSEPSWEGDQGVGPVERKLVSCSLTTSIGELCTGRADGDSAANAAVGVERRAGPPGAPLWDPSAQ